MFQPEGSETADSEYVSTKLKMIITTAAITIATTHNSSNNNMSDSRSSGFTGNDDDGDDNNYDDDYDDSSIERHSFRGFVIFCLCHEQSPTRILIQQWCNV